MHFGVETGHPNPQVNVIAGATSFTATVAASSASNSSETIALSCQDLNGSPLPCKANPSTIQPGQSSEVTVTGFNPSTDIGYDFVGTSGSDTSISPPLSLVVQNFMISASFGGSILGVDSYTGSMPYVSINGYAAPVTMSCTADQGVQCTVPSPTVSGSGQVTYTLSHLANLPAQTVVHVTMTGSNADLQRAGTSTVAISDFHLVMPFPEINLRPGEASDTMTMLVNYDTGVPNPLPNISYSCATDPAVVCKFVYTSASQANLAYDLTQYLKNGGTLPVNLQVSAAIQQNGNTVTHSVTIPVQGQDFSLSGPTDPVVVKAGDSADFSIQLNAIPGFSGPVSLQCSGAPAGSTCTASPTVSGIPGIVKFHITTTAAGQSRAVPPPAGKDDWLRPAAPAVGGLVFLLLLLAAGMAGVRGRRQALLHCAGLSVLLVLLAACGGGGGGGSYSPGSGNPPPPISTPRGTSTLTIDATFSNSAASLGPVTLSHTATVKLTVQ